MEREDKAAIENDSPNDQVVTSIREMLDGLVPLSPKCCIYNVPEKLSKLNREAYKPRAVSIGPFHGGQKSLQSMENHKLRYLKIFLFRLTISLEDYIKLVRTWEVKARYCYAKAIDLSSDEFVKMLAVDGGFVVELLLKSYFRQFMDKSDHIFYRPRMIDDVARDMVLLENQLPLFVLEGLLSLVYYNNQEENPSILDLTHEHFKNLLNINKFPHTLQRIGIEHFLDFLRFCYLPSSPGEWRKVSSTIQFSPTATNLHDAGIKFKVGESSCLLDIKFTKGVLEMPHFEVDDLTNFVS